MKILFLDIDGVLNQHEAIGASVGSNKIDQTKVQLINYILHETGCKIVLSSAWRYMVHRGDMQLSGLDWLMRSHGLHAEAIIAITDRDEVDYIEHGPEAWVVSHNRGERGRQIAKWLDEHRDVTRYVVLDDCDFGIKDQNLTFVQTDGKMGLTVTEVSQIIKILNG